MCGLLSEKKGVVTSEGTEDVQEGLVDVVVRLGAEVIVGQILLAVEGDLLCRDFPVLAIDLVAHHDNRNLATNTLHIFVPDWNVPVGGP